MGAERTDGGAPAHLDFDRAAWSRLRASTPLTLDEADLVALRGLGEPVSLTEVVEVHLPLSRLVNLSFAASRALAHVTDTFLGTQPSSAPFLIGIGGSVAVGKSTTARILQALLARWPDHPDVALVTTDGFLHPNATLEARGILHRKGFPESYDLRHLLAFLQAVKAGQPEVAAPVYSHRVYDVVPDEVQLVRRPDIVLLEGLNVLQAGADPSGRSAGTVVSDHLDLMIYVDADEQDIERWFVERFEALRGAAVDDEASFFHTFAALAPDEAVALASSVWRGINGVNLRENILPTRARAHVVLEKGADHAVRRVRLRRG